jgi:hypothetical protein
VGAIVPLSDNPISNSDPSGLQSIGMTLLHGLEYGTAAITGGPTTTIATALGGGCYEGSAPSWVNKVGMEAQIAMPFIAPELESVEILSSVADGVDGVETVAKAVEAVDTADTAISTATADAADVTGTTETVNIARSGDDVIATDAGQPQISLDQARASAERQGLDTRSIQLR